MAVIGLFANAPCAVMASLPPRVKFHSASFLVSVRGTQTNKWSSVHIGNGLCDPSSQGSGGETWQFRSRHAVKADVLSANSTVFFDLLHPLLTSGTVDRTSSISTGSSPAACGQGGGGGPSPPPPDCGRHSVHGVPVRVTYIGHRNALSLAGPDVPGRFFQFKACPIGSTSYPLLLQTPGYPVPHGMSVQLSPDLPLSELFNTHYGKIIVFGELRERYYLHTATDTDGTTVVLKFSVTLRRVG